ncbi:MAG TPA: R3H domain-containing nucleic acid-binding protein [Vicinamibacteria bacterium]|nr:R3H domain-containing nucleic acid-binding protein [Vicinamibacteria bacterium]
MKDLLFSGASVEEAVANASQALGMAREGLRYVVLAPGAPGRLGGAATPAQIAVLLDQPPRSQPQVAAAGAPARRRTPAELVGLLGDVAGLRLEGTVQEDAGATQVTLAGPDMDFFLEGEAAVLQAVDHLLQRVAQQGGLGRLSVTCEGYREWRDEALRKKALDLASDVLRDGGARTTGPLNSYERRIVHLAIETVPGVTTFSVGEGSERRVTLAPAQDGAAAEPPEPPASAEQ